MSSPYSAFAKLPDDQLLAEVTRLAACERQATADLVALLVVLDERRLYLREGYPSLFAYCTGALHLAEGAAYLRIEAARAIRRFPKLLDRLASGAITLTGVKLLAPHLTEENHMAVLEAARGKSTREIEQLVAQIHPRPDVPGVVRKLPARQVASNSPAPSSSSAPRSLAPHTAAAANQAPPVAGPAGAPAALDFVPPAVASMAVPPRRAVVTPLAPERYKLQMTISAETHERLCRARALLRDANPDGDLAVIFDRALVLLLERLERQKWGARQARRGTSGDPARPTPADAEAREDRRRVRKGGDESSGVTAGAAQPPGGGSRPGRAVCPAVTCGEQSAGPAAGAHELVAKRVPVGDDHSAGTRPGEEPAGPKTARAMSRRIPATVRRAVWLRANGQCTYVSPSGQRCAATSHLEFHHAVPYTDGGQPTVDGIRLLCRAHHARETERWFGERLRQGDHLLGP